MDCEELIRRLDCVIGDIDKEIEKLKGQRSGQYIDPVCWNCGKAYKFYLPESSVPSYTVCEIWRSTRRCAFEPRER